MLVGNNAPYGTDCAAAGGASDNRSQRPRTLPRDARIIVSSLSGRPPIAVRKLGKGVNLGSGRSGSASPPVECSLAGTGPEQACFP